MSLDDIRMRIILGVGGFENVNKATAAIKGVGTAAQQAAQGTRNAGSAAERSSTLFGRLSDTLRTTEQMYDRVFRAGFQLQLVGDKLADTGKRGLEILSGTVDKYADYDLMLRRAGVALNTNEEWHTKLDKAIQRTAVSVGLVKPEEAAAAYYYWGAATGTVVDSQEKLTAIQAVVNDTLVATAAAGGDLERNLKGVYGVMQVYNRSADEGSYITRVLALMTERTAADFGDLINAFSYIGPLANSIGVSFEDTAQLLGFLADAGQRGSRAGRGLSMILEGLSAPSIKAKAALDKVIKGAFGVNKTFAEIVFPKGEFIGMRGFIDAMAKSMTGLTDAERGYVYSTAFTNNATRALIPVVEKQIKLWNEQSKAGQKLTSVLDEQKYSLDSVQEFFGKMQEEMAGSINAVVGSFQNSFFPIIQKVAATVMKNLIPVFDALKAVFDDIGRWMDNNPAIVDFAVKLLALASVVLVVVGSVLSFVGAFLVMGAGINTVIAILGVLASAALPVIAVIAGLVAVGAVLYKAWQENWGGIQEVVAEAIDRLQAILSTLAGWAKQAVNLFMTLVSGGQAAAGALSTLPAPIQAIVGWLAKLWTAGVQAFNALRPVIEEFVAAAVTLFTQHIVPAIQAIVTAFQQVWTVVEPILIALGTILVDVIVNTVIPMLVEFAAAVGSYIIDILEMVGPVIDSVVQLFTGLINFIFKDLAPVWSWLLDNILVPFFKGMVDLFATRLQGILDIVRGAFEAIKGVIQIVLSVIKGIIDTVLALINGDFDKAGRALKTMVAGIWEGIKSIISGALTVIKGIVEFAISLLASIIGKGLGLIKNTFTTVFNGILSFLRGIFGSVTKIGSDIIANLWKGISGAVGGFLGNIGKFLSSLVQKFTSRLPASMRNIGKSVIEGLWNGIKSLAGWIASKVSALVQNIIPGPIRDILGIRSPSKVTAEIGRMVALGLAEGMLSNTRPVIDSVDMLTGAVIQRAQQGGRDMNSALAGAGLGTGNFSFSTANEKTLTLRVEVVSPDGSVDRLTTDQLAGLLSGGDLLTALEHAASLD